jgi:hypothetical protein
VKKKPTKKSRPPTKLKSGTKPLTSSEERPAVKTQLQEGEIVNMEPRSGSSRNWTARERAEAGEKQRRRRAGGTMNHPSEYEGQVRPDFQTDWTLL